MTWVRLADDFYDHPKVIEAGPMATLLWVCGIAYANRYLTDGYLPAGAVKRLVDLDDPFRLAARLVDVRLWEAVDGGYRIHDYDSYQPSAEAVKEERTKNAERVAAWRERHGNARSNGVRPAVGNAISPASPGPTPYPVPDLNPNPPSTPTPQPPSPQAGPGERPRRRRRASVDVLDAPPAAPEQIAPPTDADLYIWDQALAAMTPGLLQANAAKLAALELLGRAEDGALRVRAPPGVQGRQWQRQVAVALCDAGDAHGGQVRILDT